MGGTIQLAARPSFDAGVDCARGSRELKSRSWRGESTRSTLIRDSSGPPRQKPTTRWGVRATHTCKWFSSRPAAPVPAQQCHQSISLMQATQAGSRTFNSPKSTFCPLQNITYPSSSSPSRTQKRSQNVGKLRRAQPAALPPRVHGLLHRHDPGCMYPILWHLIRPPSQRKPSS